LHWSETLLALVTLNCLAVDAAAVAPELEFIPEVAPAEVDPVAEALAPLWSGDEALALASELFPDPLALPVT
jgi:hypothetical protein